MALRKSLSFIGAFAGGACVTCVTGELARLAATGFSGCGASCFEQAPMDNAKINRTAIR
jgi:hypothetical protein